MFEKVSTRRLEWLFLISDTIRTKKKKVIPEEKIYFNMTKGQFMRKT